MLLSASRPFFHLMCLPAILLPPDALVCQEFFFLKLLLSGSHPFSSQYCQPQPYFSCRFCCLSAIHLSLDVADCQSLYSSRCFCLPAIIPLPVTTVCRHPFFIRCCCLPVILPPSSGYALSAGIILSSFCVQLLLSASHPFFL
jgi:hypothetical protein